MQNGLPRNPYLDLPLPLGGLDAVRGVNDDFERLVLLAIDALRQGELAGLSLPGSRDLF
jgi:hypothetical protein